MIRQTNKQFNTTARLLLILYFFTLVPAAYNNTLTADGDQSKFLRAALDIHTFGMLTDGNLSFLMPLFLSPLASRDILFFTTAKWMSMVVSTLGLFAIFWIHKRLLGEKGAFAVLLLLMLNAKFRASAVFIDAETIFVPLFVLSWGASLLALQKQEGDGLKWAFGAGLFAGLAYLSKANGILLLLLFGGTLLLVVTWRIFLDKRLWGFLAGFVLMSAVLWWYNWAAFGQPFFNVNTANYFWLDSWEEGFVVSEADLPDMAGYWHTHSLAEIGERLWNGLTLSAPKQWYAAFRLAGMPPASERWAVNLFTAVCLVLATGVGWRVWKSWPRHQMPFYFSAAGILGFYVLFAWYHPISEAPRFVMVWIPVVYTAVIWLWQNSKAQAWFNPFVIMLAVFVGVWQLVTAVPHLPKMWQMAAHDKAANLRQVDFMEALLQNTQPEEAVLLGPTHGQAEWLAYDRQLINMPHVNASWPQLQTLLIDRNIAYVLLDREMYNRRLPVLKAYWQADEVGLYAESLPPGWELVKPESYPCDPCLYFVDKRPYFPQTPISQTYQNTAALLGLTHPTITPNEPFTLVTHWQLTAPYADDIHIFVHVLDGKQNLVTQSDLPLVVDKTSPPAQRYDAGLILRNEHPMMPLPPGTYGLYIGLYRFATGERIPLVGTGETYPLVQELVVGP